MTFLARQAFAKMFKSDPDDLVKIFNMTQNLANTFSYENDFKYHVAPWGRGLGFLKKCPKRCRVLFEWHILLGLSFSQDMHVIYDVSHNIAKVEEHMVDGRPKTLLVHRKGSTRAFPPHHPLIPVDYQLTGWSITSKDRPVYLQWSVNIIRLVHSDII